MNPRTVRTCHVAVRDDIGDLMTRRPLPGPMIDQLDPFLFLNHHGPQIYGPGNAGLPFGPHPHRGFETVTFILEGELAHRDSAGHQSVIHAGGVQWMTAGRGLVHAELSPDEFKRQGGSLEILQLWVNLPAQLKMTPPRYVGLQRDEIPVLPFDDARVSLSLISGRLDGHVGPIRSVSDVLMSTIAFSAGGRVRLPAAPDRSVFLYMVRGRFRVAGVTVEPFQLIELNDDGDVLDIEALSDAVALFGHARPLREPMVAYGPFVMNTREEIAQAIQDYQAGRFSEIPQS